MDPITVRRLSRRQALLGGVAVVLGLAAGRASGAAPQDLESFMALSRALTGRDDLDPAIGAHYLAALGAVPGGDLAETILTQWYSGIYRVGGRETVATYQDALVWRAMAFTAPPGQCHGALGYWSRPPDPASPDG